MTFAQKKRANEKTLARFVGQIRPRSVFKDAEAVAGNERGDVAAAETDVGVGLKGGEIGQARMIAVRIGRSLWNVFLLEAGLGQQVAGWKSGDLIGAGHGPENGLVKAMDHAGRRTGLRIEDGVL